MTLIAIQCDQHHRWSKGLAWVGRLIIADFDRYRDIWVYHCADFAIEGKGVASRGNPSHVCKTASSLLFCFVLARLHPPHKRRRAKCKG